MGEPKKNNAIVFFVNSKYRFALAEMLVNLQQTNHKLYDNIIVYHEDLSDDDIEKFLMIEPKCIFFQYSYKGWEQEFKAPTSDKAKDFIKRYSHLAYVKYKIFGLLEYYHKVLFLDLDVLILDDISELFEIKGIAWRNAVDNFCTKFESNIKMNKYPQYFSNFSNNTYVPNAGLIYVSDDGIDLKQCLADGHKFLMEFMDYFNGALDELTIAYIVEKNGIPLTCLDKNKYNTIPIWYSFDTKVVHFMMRFKIWNNEFLQNLFPQWMKNYKLASQKALFESDEIIEFKQTCVSKKLNEEAWFEFLSKTKFQVPQQLVLQYDFGKNVLYMNYNSNIFYEIVLELFAKKYRIGLWIKDQHLLRNHSFIQNIKSLSHFHFLHNEKGIYVYTDYKNDNDTVKLFDDFYFQTFNIITEYVTTSCELLDTNFKHPFFVLNSEIQKLAVKDYFEMIKSAEDRYIVLVTCKDECSRFFKDFVSLTSLPLTTPNMRDSYVAVICGGDVKFEKTSSNKICYSFLLNLASSSYVTIISEGWRQKKEHSCVVINNIDYSMNMRGLNFVVIDKLNGYVIDIFNIDTYNDKNFSINRSDESLAKIRRLESSFFKLL